MTICKIAQDLKQYGKLLRCRTAAVPHDCGQDAPKAGKRPSQPGAVHRHHLPPPGKGLIVYASYTSMHVGLRSCPACLQAAYTSMAPPDCLWVKPIICVEWRTYAHQSRCPPPCNLPPCPLFLICFTPCLFYRLWERLTNFVFDRFDRCDHLCI